MFSGVTVNVECNNGYVLDANGTDSVFLTCNEGSFGDIPTCAGLIITYSASGHTHTHTHAHTHSLSLHLSLSLSLSLSSSLSKYYQMFSQI